MKPRYEFEPLGNSPEDGYNDPLKTIFGQDAETVAKEAFQNSIDAAADPTKPVRVKVNLEWIDAKQIPGAIQLKKIFTACSKNPSGKTHFENAIKQLASKKIPVLILSDFNTTGLTGSNTDKKGKYYNFFKSVGGHNKLQGSAGSYGYGKATNIAFSAFDTFFATSLYAEKSAKKFVFMGCVRVCSHQTDEKERRGLGSFGLPGQLPIRVKTEIPSYYLRRTKEPGTDIFIPAYRDAANWKQNIIRSALKNFWPAILKSRLEVEVGDVSITAASIDELMATYFPAGTKVERWKFNDPTPYYQAYKTGKKITAKLETLGDVECYLLSGSSVTSTNHVACFRKNLMLIQHKRFESIVPFSGVFICPDEAGNIILQKMEPPQHNEWSKSVRHAQDETGITLKECSAADREYRTFLRDELKKLLTARSQKKIELGTIDEYISLLDSRDKVATAGKDDTGDEQSDKELGREVVKPQIVVERAHRKNAPKLAAIPGNDDDGEVIADGDGDQPGGGKSSGGGGEGNSSAGSGSSGGGEVTAKITRAKLRSFTVSDGDHLKTVLIIRTIPKRPNAKLKVNLKAGTDDGYEAVEIESVAPQGSISSDGAILGLKTDSRGELRLDVCFKRNERYSLKADVYEIG